MNKGKLIRAYLTDGVNEIELDLDLKININHVDYKDTFIVNLGKGAKLFKGEGKTETAIDTDDIDTK